MSAERALLAAFTVRLGPLVVIDHRANPWRSAIFSGERHLFRIEAGEAADLCAFAHDIAEADITLPRGFVADISMVETPDGSGRRIDIEALTIDA